jgi:hypothetical protein
LPESSWVVVVVVVVVECLRASRPGLFSYQDLGLPLPLTTAT